MFIETTDKETGDPMLINMDHIESIVATSEFVELRIHGSNEVCYRVAESIESIERKMRGQQRKSQGLGRILQEA